MFSRSLFALISWNLSLLVTRGRVHLRAKIHFGAIISLVSNGRGFVGDLIMHAFIILPWLAALALAARVRYPAKATIKRGFLPLLKKNHWPNIFVNSSAMKNRRCQANVEMNARSGKIIFGKIFGQLQKSSRLSST